MGTFKSLHLIMNRTPGMIVNTFMTLEMLIFCVQRNQLHFLNGCHQQTLIFLATIMLILRKRQISFASVSTFTVGRKIP